MVDNQETQTGENPNGETPTGEQQSAQTASAAGTVPETTASDTAQPESGWDTASAGTGQPADVGSTAESAAGQEKLADSATPTAPPTGAQLSPNAPRTVKKPADMKLPEPPAPLPSSAPKVESTSAASSAAPAAASVRAELRKLALSADFSELHRRDKDVRSYSSNGRSLTDSMADWRGGSLRWRGSLR